MAVGRIVHYNFSVSLPCNHGYGYTVVFLLYEQIDVVMCSCFPAYKCIDTPTAVQKHLYKKSKQYTYVSFEVIKKIIEQSREIFSNKPFGIKNLLKSIKGSKIALIKMFNEDEPLRKRTFTNNCVSALQQGADKVDINERKYLGDSYVIVDEEAVNIQLFKIEPKEINDSKDYIQYMFSFHFPKENVGFVKVKKP